jgi:outer membrane protein OmpA-like peptidoglycan-associated protein
MNRTTHTLTRTGIVLAVALALGACASAPTSTTLLEQAHAEFGAAQADPNTARYAPVELKSAADAMALADASAAHADSPASVDKLAYLARQKTALAQEAAKQKAAEADVASAGKERDRMRLAQRTEEADRAHAAAEASNQRAGMAIVSAADAQRQAADARAQTRDAQDQAHDAQARADQLQLLLTELSAKKTERGIVITMSDVLFATDIARLNPQGLETARKLAEVLKQNPQRTVAVEGFTDSTGSAAHNQDLSQRRAESVREALVQQGVQGERVSARGYGEGRPVATNDSAANRHLNRRVEIVLSNDVVPVSQR